MRPLSISTTGTPNAAAAAATERPPGPAPMTHRSGLRVSAMVTGCLHVLDHYRQQRKQAEDDERGDHPRRRQGKNVKAECTRPVAGRQAGLVRGLLRIEHAVEPGPEKREGQTARNDTHRGC